MVGEPRERAMIYDPDRKKGPVEILCKEIGFRFDRSMERRDMFVAFVKILVGHVSDMRELQARISHLTKKAPSDGSATVLAAAEKMLEAESPSDMIAAAKVVHDLSHELNPEDAYPTDHLIDMLSSCASAIRFGLELGPCQSRHAADAAQHIWKQKYGVSLFDSFTPNWENDWARAQLQDAILSLAIERQAAPVPIPTLT